MGSEEAIQRNDALISALSVAPSILFERHQTFGQVRFQELPTKLCFVIPVLTVTESSF